MPALNVVPSVCAVRLSPEWWPRHASPCRGAWQCPPAAALTRLGCGRDKQGGQRSGHAQSHRGWMGGWRDKWTDIWLGTAWEGVCTRPAAAPFCTAACQAGVATRVLPPCASAPQGSLRSCPFKDPLHFASPILQLRLEGEPFAVRPESEKSWLAHGGCPRPLPRCTARSASFSLLVSDLCRLPSESGPCDLHVRSWFYNWKAQTCEQFTYGGCLGNKNRFQTLKACKRQCARPRASGQPHDESTARVLQS